MVDISHLQLLIVFVQFFCINTLEFNKRINQEILIGPHNINTHPGETIHFPCIVSKQTDAIVTWCWNDFCTLGKAQLIRHETTNDGLISIYQYTAYPRYYLLINERLHHYNLSIIDVTNNDEGIFQCQIQRTLRANEARSERVQLILISPPTNHPRLLLPTMPLKQGQSINITCLSSPSKPASNLILYKNEQILTEQLTIFYEYDLNIKKNLTKLIYTIDNLDSNWDHVIIRCEQIYEYSKNFQRDVKEKIYVNYKPKVRIESQNHSPLTINSTATFRCIVDGNPKPEIRWFTNSMDFISVTHSIINIPLSKHVHNHTIGCTARNSIGITNTSLRLLIRYPPVFIIRPPRLVVIDLDNKIPKIIRCLVDSYPRSKIIWYRYGQIINEGSIFNLENITKFDEQGIYSYRIETDGFETIKNDFIIYIKGKPLIYIQQSKEDNRLFECQIYSSSPIFKITWKLNDQSIESNNQISITTKCDHYECISKLIYDYHILSSLSKTLNHLSCIGENQFGIEQSRLYQINTSSDPTMIFVIIILSTFILIIFFSIIAIYCCYRAKLIHKRHKHLNGKSIPIVYDEHYSINELIKEVGSLKTCNTSLNNTDQLSFKIESRDRLLTTLFNKNTKKLLDNLSNESSTNSSGFHSKSTTTIFNNEYSPRSDDFTYLGISPLYTHQRHTNM